MAFNPFFLGDQPDDPRKQKSSDLGFGAAPTDTGYAPISADVQTGTNGAWPEGNPIVNTPSDPYQTPPWVSPLDPVSAVKARQSDPLGTGHGFNYQNPGFDDPATKQYYDLMSQVISKLTGQQDRSGDDQLTKILNDTIAQYQQPVFSNADLGNLRTQAFDALNHQKSGDIQTAIRNMAQRGISPNSPYVNTAINDVNRRYDALGAQQQQNLNNFELNTQLQRPQQTVGLAQVLQQLSDAKRNEDLSNFSKALGLAGSGVSMTENRINNANGQGGLGDITQLINSILGVSNTTNAQNQTNALNNQQWYQMLGQLLAGYPQTKKAENS